MARKTIAESATSIETDTDTEMKTRTESKAKARTKTKTKAKAKAKETSSPAAGKKMLSEPGSPARKNGKAGNTAPSNLEEEIRRRAYELYLQRRATAGAEDGSEGQDWLIAEREIRSRHGSQERHSA